MESRLDSRMDRMESLIGELRERMARLEGLLEGLREASLAATSPSVAVLLNRFLDWVIR